MGCGGSKDDVAALEDKKNKRIESLQRKAAAETSGRIELIILGKSSGIPYCINESYGR